MLFRSVENHIGKTFTFINTSYVGTSSMDLVGYTSSNNQITVNGCYSVHKVNFTPYNNNYIGSGKLTGKNTFSCHLVTNNIKDNQTAITANNFENAQHNYVTLQAVSSSQYGYAWMIRDINDFEPFYVASL